MLDSSVPARPSRGIFTMIRDSERRISRLRVRRIVEAAACAVGFPALVVAIVLALEVIR